LLLCIFLQFLRLFPATHLLAYQLLTFAMLSPLFSCCLLWQFSFVSSRTCSGDTVGLFDVSAGRKMTSAKEKPLEWQPCLAFALIKLFLLI